MATQTRVVLREEDKPLVESIQDATGLSSYSEVVAFLINRYGPHLIEWCRSNPHQPESLQPLQPSTPVAAPSLPANPGVNLDPLDF